MRTGALLLACLLPGTALAADILAARYDARTDELVVDIAYRGTHGQHDFVLEWGPCRDGGVGGRLIDLQGQDAARQGFRVRERFDLAALDCARPLVATLRLGRVSHASVRISSAPGAR